MSMSTVINVSAALDASFSRLLSTIQAHLPLPASLQRPRTA